MKYMGSTLRKLYAFRCKRSTVYGPTFCSLFDAFRHVRSKHFSKTSLFCCSVEPINNVASNYIMHSTISVPSTNCIQIYELQAICLRWQAFQLYASTHVSSDCILCTFRLRSFYVPFTFWPHSFVAQLIPSTKLSFLCMMRSTITVPGTNWNKIYAFHAICVDVVHSNSVQTVCLQYSDCVPSTFRLRSVYVPSTFRLRSVYVPSTFRLSSVYVPSTFRLRSVYVPYTF